MHPAWHRSRWLTDFLEGPRRTLGFVVADWIETHCVHGPGDIAGQRIGGGSPDDGKGELDDEWLRFLALAYELDPVTGRRLRSEVVLSRPKGRAKSELAAWVALAEACGGPVRFAGWDADGQPVGKPVVSPLVKVLATEESQAGNTFEVAAFVVDEQRDRFPEVFGGVTGWRDYRSASALYLPNGGEMRACTSGAASKDGGRETFVVADETHLYVLPELRSMYATISRNLPKRAAAEPWLMQTTTAYRSGEQSIAEQVLVAHAKGELGDEVLVDHVQASGKVDLDDEEHTKRQLREVYGASAPWQDLDARYRAMRNPRICRDDAEAARYFLNRVIASADTWLDVEVWERQALEHVDRDGVAVPVVTGPAADGEMVTLGFDGSLYDDATVLIGCRVSDGYLWPVGIWERPDGVAGLGWEVPRAEVVRAFDDAMTRWRVLRAYCDPHEWRSEVDAWAEKHGEDHVIGWETRRDVAMAAALDRLRVDLIEGRAQHNGDPRMAVHVGNAYVRRKAGHRLVRKEHDSSPRKIDSVVGAALAYEARADSIAAGEHLPPPDTTAWAYSA